METPELTKTEMLEILKDIARTATNQAARIAAIKELRTMSDEKARDEPAGVMDAAPRRTSHLRAV